MSENLYPHERIVRWVKHIDWWPIAISVIIICTLGGLFFIITPYLLYAQDITGVPILYLFLPVTPLIIAVVFTILILRCWL